MQSDQEINKSHTIVSVVDGVCDLFKVDYKTIKVLDEENDELEFRRYDADSWHLVVDFKNTGFKTSYAFCQPFEKDKEFLENLFQDFIANKNSRLCITKIYRMLNQEYEVIITNLDDRRRYRNAEEKWFYDSEDLIPTKIEFPLAISKELEKLYQEFKAKNLEKENTININKQNTVILSIEQFLNFGYEIVTTKYIINDQISKYLIINNSGKWFVVDEDNYRIEVTDDLAFTILKELYVEYKLKEESAKYEVAEIKNLLAARLINENYEMVVFKAKDGDAYDMRRYAANKWTYEDQRKNQHEFDPAKVGFLEDKYQDYMLRNKNADSIKQAEKDKYWYVKVKLSV